MSGFHEDFKPIVLYQEHEDDKVDIDKKSKQHTDEDDINDDDMDDIHGDNKENKKKLP